MTIFLSDILKLYLFTPGRRAYALRQVRKHAAEHKLRDVVLSIDQALAHEERAATLESAWGAARVGREAGPREVDILIDRVLVMIEQIISHYIGDSDPDIAAAANDLHSTLLP